MIHIRFIGGLGNQMFQYAAARLAAERLGCGLFISQGWFSWRDALTRRPSMSLFKVFPHLYAGIAPGCIDFAERHGRGMAVWIERQVFHNRFRPWSPSVAPYEGLEGYDPGYPQLRKFTRLVGYFQSPLYMQFREEAVRRWFGVSAEETAQVQRRWSEVRIDPTETVAVHVRLGDYRRQIPIGETKESGWVLPASYYRRALESIGRRRTIALFSDEPDAAADLLGRRADYVSRSGDQGVDLRMMSSCKYMVIGNSTFSWWAAWLNMHADREIVAPEYFLGRNLQVWYPRDIKVDGWTYL
jgi:hypothetical protein